MNNKINELYKTIEAKDKIINEQALEIARLNEKIDILIEDNKQLEEMRIKVIEYIDTQVEDLETDSSYLKSQIQEIYIMLGDKKNE